MNKISSFYMYHGTFGLHYQSKEDKQLESLTISRFPNTNPDHIVANINLTSDEIDFIRTALRHVDLDGTSE